ncbi:MAG TPA: hypothetical protein VHL11_05565, partial [Phototrophicaceae bacterium]|nr:hypothetical protein [Phototrophicaceae bacterium]
KVRCDDAPIENCVFQFKGGTGENSSLRQQIDTSTILPGDALTLSVRVNQKSGLPDQKVVTAKLIYADNTVEKLVLRLPENPSADFVILSANANPIQTLKENSTRVIVQYKGQTGTFWIDVISLKINVSSDTFTRSEIVPLP